MLRLLPCLYLILCCALLFAALAPAAYVDGSWVIERKTPYGTATLLLNLEVVGDKLKGTIQSEGGSRETAIENGRISGDEVSFTTVRRGDGDELKVFWTGKVSGDRITGEMKMDMFPAPRPFIAKRR